MMNAKELFIETGNPDHPFKPSTIFFCGACRVVHREKSKAEKCCTKTLCEKCNSPVEQNYWTVCEECRRIARIKHDQDVIEKAEKLESWDGPVYLDGYGNEGFCADLGELLDYLDDDDEGDRPEFAFVCTETPIALNASDLIERETEEWPEDLAGRLDGVGALQAACDAFCALNTKVVVWNPDMKRMVRIPKQETASPSKDQTK